MLLEASIGDAYGAGFEFRELDFIHEHNDLTRYFEHGYYSDIYKKYTDDTQMAIAISELLLEQSDWNEIRVADKFVEVFQRDKRNGYSKRVYAALDASINGKELLRNLNNGSNGNGSAMRAYPIGLLNNVEQVLEFAKIQAQVSHNTEEGIICAQRIALAAHYYFNKLENSISLIEFLNETLKVKGDFRVISPIDMHGYPTTNAVVKLISHETSIRNCLKTSIDCGGDTDTVAALCMALLSQKENCSKELPAFLFDELENAQYGRDFLIDLDSLLIKKFRLHT